MVSAPSSFCISSLEPHRFSPFRHMAFPRGLPPSSPIITQFVFSNRSANMRSPVFWVEILSWSGVFFFCSPACVACLLWPPGCCRHVIFSTTFSLYPRASFRVSIEERATGRLRRYPPNLRVQNWSDSLRSNDLETPPRRFPPPSPLDIFPTCAPTVLLFCVQNLSPRDWRRTCLWHNSYRSCSSPGSRPTSLLGSRRMPSSCP